MTRFPVKLFAFITAMGIVGLSVPWLSTQLTLLSVTFPSGVVDQTINFPDYHKKIYIVHEVWMLSANDTIYVQEGRLSRLKKIGSTPRYAKETTRIDESEIIKEGNILKFEDLDVHGQIVNVFYNLKTGEIKTEVIRETY